MEAIASRLEATRIEWIATSSKKLLVAMHVLLNFMCPKNRAWFAIHRVWFRSGPGSDPVVEGSRILRARKTPLNE